PGVDQPGHVAVKAGRGDVGQLGGQGAGGERPVAEEGLHDPQPDRVEQEIRRRHAAYLTRIIIRNANGSSIEIVKFAADPRVAMTAGVDHNGMVVPRALRLAGSAPRGRSGPAGGQPGPAGSRVHGGPETAGKRPWSPPCRAPGASLVQALRRRPLMANA